MNVVNFDQTYNPSNGCKPNDQNNALVREVESVKYKKENNNMLIQIQNIRLNTILNNVKLC